MQGSNKLMGAVMFPLKMVKSNYDQPLTRSKFDSSIVILSISTMEHKNFNAVRRLKQTSTRLRNG